LIVYVDDIILPGNDGIEMERLKRNLAVDFEIKDLGPLKYFLGMEVERSKKGIVVSQRKYVLYLLQATCMSGCKHADTPKFFLHVRIFLYRLVIIYDRLLQ
jgi:hypothetical protein